MQANIDGVATYDLVDQGKNNLETMLRCCDAEDAAYWAQPEGQRLCAAPYYYERAAILSRKIRDYAGEVQICERWKAIANDYKKQPLVKARQAALNHKGPRAEAILSRLTKAKELLKKQKAASKSKA